MHQLDDGRRSSPTASRRRPSPATCSASRSRSLVDSKDPDAKPLPVAKMMVHHLLYFTPGRVDERPGGCLGGAFLGGRGEEHPNGQFAALYPPDIRARYGVRNATRDGAAPAVVADRDGDEPLPAQKRFYVRTKIWYTTEPRTQVYPTTVGDCRHLRNGMAYDVPGGGEPGSTFTDRSTWTVPFNGRILAAASHHHGGAIAPDAGEPDVQPHAARREGLLRRRRPPVQHDPPDPARAGADRQRHVRERAGHPGRRRRGARARRGARQLDAARRGDGLLGAAARARRHASRACAPLPRDLREVTAPAQLRPRGAVRLRPRGAAAVNAGRGTGGRSAAPPCRSATSTSGRRG